MPSSLLALLDDIATVLDDVAALTKVAAKKTAGVLGDDLALNAQQVAGVKADRELPVVWAVAKGSAVNKLILVPAALLISVFAPWAVVPLLMFGGAFLCFEGVEKLLHKLLHKKDETEHHAELISAVADPDIDLVAHEKNKVKGAIRTDFILSAEIIAITLGTVAGAGLGVRIAVMSLVAAVMTVGVYGLVAGIVRLDDLGQSMVSRGEGRSKRIGELILAAAPKLMKFLSIAGTAAMFMVGGGILVHGIHPVAELIASWEAAAGTVSVVGGVLGWLTGTVASALFGVLAGGVAVLLVETVKRVAFKKPAAR